MKITEEQARVAKALIDGPKGLEELESELGVPREEIKKALDELMKFGVVRLSKDKYRLAEAVRRGLKTGQTIKPEEYKFRAYIIIEGISENKAVLEQAQEAVLNAFKNDPRFEILDLNVEEVIENEGVFTSMFEAEVVTKTFHDLVYLVLNYGPSSVELIEPASFEIKASEAQAILVDIAEVIQMYTQTIAKLQKELGPRQPRIRLKLNKPGE